MSDLPLPPAEILPENSLYYLVARTQPLLVCNRCSERAGKLTPTRHDVVLGSRDEYRCLVAGCGLIRGWG